MTTLYERITAKADLNTIVTSFYEKVLADTRISSFFETTDIKRQQAKQKAFLAVAFGGPNRYTGKSMAEGHSHLWDRGLNDSHFDAVVELLAKTLREFEVSEVDIQQVAVIAESTRNDILGRK